jgi:small subunit ribosomal protein S11e
MADAQIEKAFLKQEGINAYNKYLLHGVEQPTKTKTIKKENSTLKRKSKKMKAVRYFKKVGLGFNTPHDAIHGHYVDKKCPFTGNASISGRIIKGIVLSTKMNKTVIVRRDYLHYIKKYQRYEKRHTNIPAHCSPCFKRITVGDIVTIGQTRPLSKTVRFNVLKYQPKTIYGNVRKQFMLF